MSQPNIIVLLPDQWRADCLSHRGHPDARTPWIDQLASEGLALQRAFSPVPVCIPARMALLTGMSPWANGRIGYQENVPWRPPHTIPGILRDHGYQTIQVGKTHFCPMRAHLGFEINDLYEASSREAGFISDYHRELAQALPAARDAALERNPNALTVTPWTAERHWHCSEWITTRAIQRLEQRDPTRPFFMQIGWHRPHPPFDPPLDLWQEWRDRAISEPAIGDWVVRSEPGSLAQVPQGLNHPVCSPITQRARRAYFASLAHIDEQVGRILWALRQCRCDRDTWIVFTSDHGEMLGDHHAWHKSLPNRAAAEIPMIIRPPADADLTLTLTDNATPVSLAQLGPSMLHWAGVEVPALCDQPSLEAHPQDWIHLEQHWGTRGWHAIIEREWAWHWFSDGTERLFHHPSDPSECHDRSRSDPNIAERLRSHLIELLAQRGCGTSDGRSLQCGHHLAPTQAREWQTICAEPAAIRPRK